jgi:hypothetical protein
MMRSRAPPGRLPGRAVSATLVRASAEKRLGMPLLKAYLGLAIFGAVVVAASVIVMHLR